MLDFLLSYKKTHKAYAQSAYQDSTVSVNRVYHGKPKEVNKKADVLERTKELNALAPNLISATYNVSRTTGEINISEV